MEGYRNFATKLRNATVFVKSTNVLLRAHLILPRPFSLQWLAGETYRATEALRLLKPIDLMMPQHPFTNLSGMGFGLVYRACKAYFAG